MMAQRRQATRPATFCKGMTGWVGSSANSHDAQNRIEDFRMTLLGGLINSETQPAFARDILYEDASPRDTDAVWKVD